PRRRGPAGRAGGARNGGRGAGGVSCAGRRGGRGVRPASGRGSARARLGRPRQGSVGRLGRERPGGRRGAARPCRDHPRRQVPAVAGPRAAADHAVAPDPSSRTFRGGVIADLASTHRVRELARRLGQDRIERDVPLAPYTTFRIGGPADLFYRARTPDELANAVLAARELEI